MKNPSLVGPRGNRTVVRPGLFIVLALSILPGCAGTSSGLPIASTLTQQTGNLTEPNVAANKHRQTIFIASGLTYNSYVYLFHGDGKKSKPYRKVPQGTAFELAVDRSGTLYDLVDTGDPGSLDEYSAPYNQPPREITDGIVGPQGLAVSADGTLYVANCGYNNCGQPFISVYAPGQTHPSRTIANSLEGPLAVDRKGRLFVCDEGFGFIDYYKKGSSQYIQAHFQGYAVAYGIATDKSGNYYLSNGPQFSNYSQPAVLEYGIDGPEGGPITRTIVSDGKPGGFSPQGLAVDDQGNLYVADQANHGVAVYAPGQTTPYAFLPYGGLAVAVTHSL